MQHWTTKALVSHSRMECETRPSQLLRVSRDYDRSQGNEYAGGVGRRLSPRESVEIGARWRDAVAAAKRSFKGWRPHRNPVLIDAGILQAVGLRLRLAGSTHV